MDRYATEAFTRLGLVRLRASDVLYQRCIENSVHLRFRPLLASSGTSGMNIACMSGRVLTGVFEYGAKSEGEGVGVESTIMPASVLAVRYLRARVCIHSV